MSEQKSDEIQFNYHLDFQFCSRRVVRVRFLSDPEQREIEASAASAVGKDATNAAWNAELERRGVVAMLLAITREKCADRKAEGAEWTLLSAQVLEMSGPNSFASLFKPPHAKDVQALRALFRKLHYMTTEEANDIEGKLLQVSPD